MRLLVRVVATIDRAPPPRHTAGQPSRLAVRLRSRATELRRNWFGYVSTYLRQSPSTGHQTVRLCARATSNHHLGNGSTPLCAHRRHELSIRCRLRFTPSLDQSHHHDQIGCCLRGTPPMGIRLVSACAVGLQGARTSSSSEVCHVPPLGRTLPAKSMPLHHGCWGHHSSPLSLLSCQPAGEEERWFNLDAFAPWLSSSASASVPVPSPPQQRWAQAASAPHRLHVCLQTRLGALAPSPARTEWSLPPPSSMARMMWGTGCTSPHWSGTDRACGPSQDTATTVESRCRRRATHVCHCR